LRRGYSLLAIHCGYLETEIDQLSYCFYKDIISEISINLRYGAVVHLLSRDYSDEKVSKYVEEMNPFSVDIEVHNDKKTTGKKVTLGMLKSMGVIK
jgi:hypothetical protein